MTTEIAGSGHVAATGASLSPSHSDAALVAAARNDRAAFEAIYRVYVDRIYRYCLAKTGSRAAAEDATAQAFLKALASFDRFRGGSLAAWLFTIAGRAATDALRKGRAEVAIDHAAAIADAEPTPEQEAVARAEREAFRRAVVRLPAAQRAAVELQIAGWSLSESAEAMERSPAAVKMLRARALAALRKQLNVEQGR